LRTEDRGNCKIDSDIYLALITKFMEERISKRERSLLVDKDNRGIETYKGGKR